MMLALALDAWPPLLPLLLPGTVNSPLPELCGFDELGGASDAPWEVAVVVAVGVGVGCAIARSESNDWECRTVVVW